MKYPTKENAEANFDGTEVTVTNFKQVVDKTQTIYFRVGTQGNNNDLSAVLSMRLIACGDETLTANPIPRAINFVYKTGDGPKSLVSNVDTQVYMSYFKTSFESCTLNKFEIAEK